MIDKTYNRDSVRVTFEELDAGDAAESLVAWLNARGGNYVDDGSGVLVNVVISFPTQLELCPVCGGHGTHVHPDIDGAGLTPSDLADWDEEERANYYSGAYDVPCRACSGNKTLQVIDYDAVVRLHGAEANLPPEKRVQSPGLLYLLEAYYADGEADADFEAESEAERRAGC